MKAHDPKDENCLPSNDISSRTFKRYANHAAEWISKYLEAMDQYPVLAQTKPGEIKSKLPSNPPESPESFDQIFSDFDQIIMPGITHWNHPRFFGYFSITGSYPGIIGEFLSSALNVNAMLWKT
ncbi:pyridoxal-dependent decarboxylase, partial [candidate division KSB1 bacterium]|nr:pyridoxal-dependent decarboxylase [candidate division KSB1 bacterium]